MGHDIKRAWKRAHNRGLTLVELMIVVAIIGILSSAAVLAFDRASKKGTVSRLESFAMQLKRGQEDFRARHGQYFPLGGTGTGGTINLPPDGNRDVFENLLGFSETVPQDVLIRVESGVAGGACTICPMGITPQTANSAWFVVVVEQDMDPSAGSPNVTQVVVTRETIGTIIVNEFE